MRKIFRLGCLTILLIGGVLAILWYRQLEFDTPQRLAAFVNAVGPEKIRDWARVQITKPHSPENSSGDNHWANIQPADFFQQLPEFTKARLCTIKVFWCGEDTEENKKRDKYLAVQMVLYQAGNLSQHLLYIIDTPKEPDWFGGYDKKIAEGIWYDYGGSR